MKVIYITGGARSGKSAYAESRVREMGGQVTYMATARALDEEMRSRVLAHQARRPGSWGLFEGSTGLAGALDQPCTCALLDCVPNLVTNLMLDGAVDWEHHTVEHVQEVVDQARFELDALLARARERDVSLVIVSGEVGLGLVPAYPIGRAFRDALGLTNQRLAAVADEVWFLVSGIPVPLKMG